MDQADRRLELFALSDKYDEQMIAVMNRVLSADSCCIDVGAHWGAILKHIVGIAPRGSHLAFEPLPHLAAQLREWYPEVRVSQAALSDQAGQSSFIHVENDEPTAA